MAETSLERHQFSSPETSTSTETSLEGKFEKAAGTYMGKCEAQCEPLEPPPPLLACFIGMLDLGAVKGMAFC